MNVSLYKKAPQRGQTQGQIKKKAMGGGERDTRKDLGQISTHLFLLSISNN